MGYLETETSHARYQIHFAPLTPAPMMGFGNHFGIQSYHGTMRDLMQHAPEADRIYGFFGHYASGRLQSMHDLGDLKRELAIRVWDFPEIWNARKNGDAIPIHTLDPLTNGTWMGVVIEATQRRAQIMEESAAGGVALGVGAAALGRKKLSRRAFLKTAAGAGLVLGAAGAGLGYELPDRTDSPGAGWREALYFPGKIGWLREYGRKVTVQDQLRQPEPHWTFSNAYAAVGMAREMALLGRQLGQKPRVMVIVPSAHAALPESLANLAHAEAVVRQWAMAPGFYQRFHPDSLKTAFEIDPKGELSVVKSMRPHPASDLLHYS